MTDALIDGNRYLDRHGDTWEAREEGTYLLHMARADGGHLIAPDNVQRWYETADTVIRDFGPMTPIT